MINFTVGPVQSSRLVRKIGSEQVPYFRTPEFSSVMFENENLILEFLHAPKSSRAVFITGSGTASMEASIINILNSKDRVLVINGGSFGKRFVELLSIHEIDYDEIKLELGKALSKDVLSKYENNGKKYTALIVNIHETSTGVHYDLEMLSKFCKKHGMLLIVDAISSFLADELDMERCNVDAVIIGSQKALACPPGVSIIALSPRALERVKSNNPKCMYLNLNLALTNGERGQTPFTPAVGTLRQINARLKQIKDNGGVESEIKRISNLAHYFREQIKDLPLKIVPERMSNAVTALHPLNVSAYSIFTTLKDRYKIWVCPNGGEYKDIIFRVGHIGELTLKDYNKLIRALRDMQKRGEL